MPVLTRTLTLNDAQTAISAAMEAANALGVRATIIVLDAGGDLVAAHRMDGAWAGAFDLALAKAQTARAFAASSGFFTPLVQPGSPLFGVTGVAGGRYLALPGGEPIVIDDGMAGAIGASGGSPDQDEAIARTGLAAATSK